MKSVLLASVVALGIPPENLVIELPFRPAIVWTFKGGGSEAVSAFLHKHGPLYVLHPESGTAGYGLVRDSATTVGLVRFNWRLMKQQQDIGIEQDTRYLTGGVVPNLGQAIDWALSIYAFLEAEPPTETVEFGSMTDPEWHALLQRMRTDPFDRLIEGSERLVSEQLRKAAVILGRKGGEE